MQASVAETPLTANDRCDRCTAGARVRARLLNGELLFCGHHARVFRDTISEKSVSIYDPERILKNVNI